MPILNPMKLGRGQIGCRYWPRRKGLKGSALFDVAEITVGEGLHVFHSEGEAFFGKNRDHVVDEVFVDIADLDPRLPAVIDGRGLPEGADKELVNGDSRRGNDWQAKQDRLND